MSSVTIFPKMIMGTQCACDGGTDASPRMPDLCLISGSVTIHLYPTSFSILKNQWFLLFLRPNFVQFCTCSCLVLTLHLSPPHTPPHFAKNVHPSGVSDPRHPCRLPSVMATICFPTLLMFLLYLPFLLHFLQKPAGALHLSGFTFNKKAITASFFPYFRERGLSYLGKYSKNMGTQCAVPYLFDKFSIS